MNENATEPHIPTVAIIGRPNVGKSTLFNRLVGRRRAITDPTPGVTRDLLRETWIAGGRPVTLVDSGGIKAERDEMDSLVMGRSLSLLEDSEVILLLLDCVGTTGEDEIIMQRLRPYADKVVLVVNKVDNPEREHLVWNCFAYGYQRVVGISSLHGRGIGDLEDIVAGMLGPAGPGAEAPQEEERTGIRLAVMGKPNTGKSTLVNLLVGEDLSLVSPVPGTTRDVVAGAFSYKGTGITILDTAGIRRKSKVEEDVEYYSVNRSIKTIDHCDIVLLMIDVKEGLSEQDKKIASLIVRRGRGIILVLNKTDLLSGIKNEFEAIVDRLRFLFPVLGFAPVVGLSALTGANLDKVLRAVLDVWRQLNMRVGTSELNAALASWSADYTPPRGALGHYKLMYGTQISVNPVRFLLFCNRMKGFPEPYLAYIKNRIRRDLGFRDIPVDVVLRERSRSESKAAQGPRPPRPKSPASPPAPSRAPREIRQPRSGKAVARPRPTRPAARRKAAKKGR